jgi:dCTP deaminase
MATLLQSAIEREIKAGNIVIEPFNPERLNPNSYDVTLGRKMLVLDPGGEIIDPKQDISHYYREIPIETDSDGQHYFTLWPGQLYLGVTNEYTETDGYVPIMHGKSSLARMGVSVHYCAGFGDIGFSGHWTCEFTVMYPVRLYVNLPIGQLEYNTVEGELDNADYSVTGSYNNNEPMPGVPNTWKKWGKYFPEFAQKS